MTNFVLTAALPYANGDLHIGHIYEAVLADIKSRFYKEIGVAHTFVCGADSHGAATTLYCQKHNLDIESHLELQHQRNSAVYKAFDVSFSFSKTNTPLHHFVVNECVELLFENQKNLGQVLDIQEVLGWYDINNQQYLPERYVKGTCPYCNELNQVEICDKCQHHIENKDLINPKSTLSQGNVCLKANPHLVLKTNGFYEFLLANKELIPASIRDFVLSNKNENSYIDISREKPYYGIEIDKPYIDIKKQCFYVWFDAPIGYITFAYQEHLKRTNQQASHQDFRDFLKTVKFEHFIGKDIVYFHTYLWFNLLKFICFGNLPIEKINVHGWIVDKEKKLSKSSGDSLSPEISKRDVREYRLFFFSQYTGTQTDVEYKLDLIKKEYENLVVNKFGNFYSRAVRLASNLNLSLKKPELKKSWLKDLSSGNYKAVYLELVEEITELNSAFTQRQLWKEEDKDLLEKDLKSFLEQWIILFEVLALIIPEFEPLKEKVLRLEPFHLDVRVK